MFSTFGRSGIAWDRLRRILRSSASKYGKVHVRQCGKRPQRLVIGIGQIHPVLRGRFERFQVRRIAAVQYWMFRFCNFLAEEEKIHCFGKEGFASMDGKRIRARLPLELQEAMLHEQEKAGSVKSVFKRAAEKWRKALRKSRIKQAHAAMRSLDALSLLQANNSQVTVFPLEREGVHSAIHKNMNSLQDQISVIELSTAFRSAKSKEGKGLSQEEVQAFLQRNKLVQSFNQLLSDPKRDQAIFENVMTYAASEDDKEVFRKKLETDKLAKLAKFYDGPVPEKAEQLLKAEIGKILDAKYEKYCSVTVFVLGHGHRDRFLTLAKKQLPADTLFAWITPPQLWLWRAMLQYFGWLILCFVLVALAFLS